MALSALFLLAAYLLGSMPIVYLLARRHGVDLHQTGTRTVGGGNLWHQVSALDGFLGTLADTSKGALPPLIAPLLGLGPWTAALGAVAAVLGQMWPVFLGFNGGRGNVTGMAALLVLAPGALLVGMVPVLIGLFIKKVPDLVLREVSASLRSRFQGMRSRSLPLGVFLGVLTILPAAALLGYPISVAFAAGSIALFILVRRATAELSRDRQATKDQRLAILRSRLLYDRERP